jgi:hypothetical protein
MSINIPIVFLTFLITCFCTYLVYKIGKNINHHHRMIRMSRVDDNVRLLELLVKLSDKYDRIDFAEGAAPGTTSMLTLSKDKKGVSSAGLPENLSSMKDVEITALAGQVAEYIWEED